MIYLAIFILGAISGYALGKIDAFVDGMDEQYGACNQNCRQGRDCTCAGDSPERAA